MNTANPSTYFPSTDWRVVAGFTEPAPAPASVPAPVALSGFHRRGEQVLSYRGGEAIAATTTIINATKPAPSVIGSVHGSYAASFGSAKTYTPDAAFQAKYGTP